MHRRKILLNWRRFLSIIDPLASFTKSIDSPEMMTEEGATQFLLKLKRFIGQAQSTSPSFPNSAAIRHKISAMPTTFPAQEALLLKKRAVFAAQTEERSIGRRFKSIRELSLDDSSSDASSEVNGIRRHSFTTMSDVDSDSQFDKLHRSHRAQRHIPQLPEEEFMSTASIPDSIRQLQVGGARRIVMLPTADANQVHVEEGLQRDRWQKQLEAQLFHSFPPQGPEVGEYLQQLIAHHGHLLLQHNQSTNHRQLPLHAARHHQLKSSSSASLALFYKKKYSKHPIYTTCDEFLLLILTALLHRQYEEQQVMIDEDELKSLVALIITQQFE